MDRVPAGLIQILVERNRLFGYPVPLYLGYEVFNPTRRIGYEVTKRAGNAWVSSRPCLA
jgi:hypothetical protein